MGGNFSEIKGKKILNLACGAINMLDNLTSRDYEPWLCRCLREAGAEVTGIDLGRGEEVFNFIQKDLSKKGELDFLQTDSYDYIFCERFVSFSQDEHSSLVSPLLKTMTGEKERKEIRDELLLQANRLLVEGGLLLTFNYDYIIQQKQNGELVRIK
jgi:hypothetical protein